MYRLTRVLSASVLAASALVVAGSTTPATATPTCTLPVFGPGATYHPVIDRKHTGPNVDNPWFPLTPGTTFVNVGTKDGKTAVNVVTVSTDTRWVDGVRNRVVRDRLYLNGVLEERTSDYYSQDRCGNVWYFGEDTAELDKAGHVVSREGSWHSGVLGAKPGIYMPAKPVVGQKFRQEWWAGHAQDVFTVVSTTATASSPYRTFHSAVSTKETNALEPGVVDHKFFARGIGQVSEGDTTGEERLALVDVLH